MPYVALIPCGPAPVEIERISDLLAALQHHDPANCLAAVVLNDGHGAVDSLPKAGFCKVVPHPRDGQGWGWGGGLIAGELWACAWAVREYPDAGCVVKFDTDALPIRSLAARLDRIFAEEKVGLAGSRIDANPLPPYKTTNPLSYFRTKVRKLRAPISLWRKPRWHLRQALWGSHRWVASLYDEAEQQGYLEGELIEGGSFAIGAECIRRLVARGITDRWREFLDAPVSDDVVMTMLPYVVGCRAVEAPLFCIEPATLRYPPDRLLADPEAGVVHSLKRYENLTERDLRAAFAAARQRLS